MAEFCLECFNKRRKTNYKRRHVVLDYDLCEGCGQWKKCIIKIRYKPLFNRKKKIKQIKTNK